MATYKGVNKTKADNPTGANILSKGLIGGNVKVMHDYYEAAGEASGSIIELGHDLPKGAKVLAINLATDDLGNNATLQVGDYEDDDRYYDATDHGAGSAKDVWCDKVDGKGYEVDMTTASTPDSQIIITTGTAAITGTIKISIFYTED